MERGVGRVFRREKGVNGEGWGEGIQEGNLEGRYLRIPYNIPTFLSFRTLLYTLKKK